MKIVIIGPGVMSIPPVAWGAVEILIWNYKLVLEKFGHEVTIINTSIKSEIIEKCNSLNPDFVHIQYDLWWFVAEHLDCKKIAITSHYAYIDQESKWSLHYRNIFNGFKNLQNCKIFALSDRIKDFYVKNGIDKNQIKVVPNGVRTELFNYNPTCSHFDRSIYLGKIEQRKRQYLYQNIRHLYFAGPPADPNFNLENRNYLGEWTKETVYDDLTNYANLVLLSDGEAHPLVCIEALTAGLGLVVSESASANLDNTLPFIDVITEKKILDIDYVSKTIEKNREKSIFLREEIREWAVSNFQFEHIVKNYYLKYIEEF